MNAKPIKQLAVLFCVVALLVGLVAFYQQNSDQRKVAAMRMRMNELVEVGNDIFEAEELLRTEGFRITASPRFATKNQDYYQMVVDFGVRPSTLATIRYTLELGGSESSIYGIIEANSKGKITKVE